MQPGPHPPSAPLGEAPVDGGPGRPEHRRQPPPGAARGGQEDDRRQTFAVPGPTSPATLRAYDLRRRDHTPKQRPQLVRHQPLHQIRHAPLNERSRHQKRRLKPFRGHALRATEPQPWRSPPSAPSPQQPTSTPTTRSTARSTTPAASCTASCARVTTRDPSNRPRAPAANAAARALYWPWHTATRPALHRPGDGQAWPGRPSGGTHRTPSLEARTGSSRTAASKPHCLAGASRPALAQAGQPVPRLRLDIRAWYSCPTGQRHQTLRCEPGPNWSGEASLRGCHSATKPGECSLSAVRPRGTYPAHCGQPVPATREWTWACQTCPSSHRQNTAL